MYVHYNIPGHTKFFPDRWFGIIKKYLLKNCIIENYEDALDAIEKSSDFINKDRIISTSKLYCEKNNSIPLVKYDFK